MIDPLFKKTTQLFDGVTASKLMSATLPVNEDLRLLLDSNMKNIGKEEDRKSQEFNSAPDQEYRSLLSKSL